MAETFEAELLSSELSNNLSFYADEKWGGKQVGLLPEELTTWNSLLTLWAAFEDSWLLGAILLDEPRFTQTVVAPMFAPPLAGHRTVCVKNTGHHEGLRKYTPWLP